MYNYQNFYIFKKIIPIIKKKNWLILAILIAIILTLTTLVTFINSTKINHLKNTNIANTSLIEKSMIIEEEAYKSFTKTEDSRISNLTLEKKSTNNEIIIEAPEIKNEVYEVVTFKAGDNFIKVLKAYNVDSKTSIALSDALGKIIPSNLIRIGDKLKVFNNNNTVDKIIFITKNEEILIKKDLENQYKATIIPPILEKQYSLKKLTINGTVYKTAQESKIPPDVINRIIANHSQDLNFNKDIKDGDEITIFYSTNINSSNNKILEYKLIYSSIKYKNERNSKFFRYKDTYGNEAFYNSDGISVNKIIFIPPVSNSKITSRYGMRMHPVLGYEKMHRGDDYQASLNSPIVATADGQIDFIGEKGDYGNYIRINHKSGLQTAYAHLNKYSKSIKRGDSIKQGEIIGYAGSSGLSTGPHLHYEVIRNGEKIDPSNFTKEITRVNLEDNELLSFKKERNKIIQLMEAY
tara:strand:+ start:1220 stop:2614 length:1395 start_codon:yes stop_codon:yes gene_type:complete